MCGLFKSIGNTLGGILRDPLPAIGTAVGSYFGGPVGAGLGDAAGNFIAGHGAGTSIKDGFETGAVDYALGGIGDAATQAANDVAPETTAAISDSASDLVPNNPFPETTAAFGDTLNSLNPLGNDSLVGGDGADASLGGTTAPTSGQVNLANSGAPVSSAPIGGTNPNSFTDLLKQVDPTAVPGGASANAAGTVAPQAPPGPTSTGLKGILDKIGISPVQALTGGALAANALAGNKASEANKNLQAGASTQSAEGQQLIADAQNGQLPAGMDASIEQQTNDAITAIKSKYAQLGLSGSSSEQQAIQQAQQQASQQRSSQLQQILTQGLSAVGSANSTDQTIVQNQLSNDKSLYETLVGLAGLGGGGSASKAAAD